MKKSLNFILLLIANTLATSMYSTVAPYFPKEAAKKGISSALIGVILSCYPITALSSSLLLGKYIGNIGKEKVLLLGCLLESIAVFGFSILPNMSYTIFILSGIILRLMQGLGAGCISVSILAIVSCEYLENIQERLGLVEIAVSLGFLLGPLGASGLYTIGGFHTIFITYGLIFLVILVVLGFIIKKTDKTPVRSEEIPIYAMIKNREIFLYGLTFMGSVTCICFISPTLSLHLAEFQIPESLFGAVFAIPTLSYAATILVIRKLKYAKRNIMIGGYIILIIANLIIGPWNYTYLPHRFYICIIGLVLLGFGLCTCNLIGAPMIIHIAQINFPQHDKEKVSDVASGLITFFTFLPEIYAPPLSGILRDHFGFENTQAILSVNLSFLLVVFIAFTVAMTKAQQVMCEIELEKLRTLEVFRAITN